MPMNLANMEGGQHITTADDVKLEIYETLEPGVSTSFVGVMFTVAQH
jgi:hypothetical protein